MGVGFAIATSTSVTGFGVFAGGAMAVHGGINSLNQIAKIIITTVAAEKYGDDFADHLDTEMPDTAVGSALYLIGWGLDELLGMPDGMEMRGKIGAFGDILDIALGV